MDILYTVEEKYLQAVDELNYGELPKALRYFNAIINQDPTYARAYYQLGSLYYYQFKNYQTAGYYYKQCITLEPEFPETYEHYLKLLIELGLSKTIAKVAEKALSIPGVCKAHIFELTGMLAESQQRFGEAKEHYKKAALLTSCQTEHGLFKDHLKRIQDKQLADTKMIYTYDNK